MQDLPDAKPLPRIDGHVQFEHVTFGYNPDRPVLHDVSFEAAPGQTIALVGATGSGKSSIISLIARFYQPQQGRVLVDGHDIRHVTGESLHQQMGLVLQVNYLFTGTVMENIRYARPDATDEEVIDAARAIGSHESDPGAQRRLSDRSRRARGEHVAGPAAADLLHPRLPGRPAHLHARRGHQRRRHGNRAARAALAGEAARRAARRSSSPTASARSCGPTASW